MKLLSDWFRDCGPESYKDKHVLNNLPSRGRLYRVTICIRLKGEKLINVEVMTLGGEFAALEEFLDGEDYGFVHMEANNFFDRLNVAVNL